MFADYYVITLYKIPFSRFSNEDTTVCSYKVNSYKEMTANYERAKRIIMKSNVLQSVRVVGHWTGRCQEQIYFWKKS